MFNTEKWNLVKENQPMVADFLKETAQIYINWLETHTGDILDDEAHAVRIRKFQKLSMQLGIMTNTGADLKEHLKKFLEA